MADHYYSAVPESKHKPMEFTTEIRGKEFRFRTDAGVFSRERLDLGTRILMESLDLTGVTTPLDLGCGYGPVGLGIARELPQFTVYMSDINTRATELAKENASLNGIENIITKQGDGFGPWETLFATGLRFDLVVTNPPLRTGKKTVLRLFNGAWKYMAPHGSLWTVIKTSQGAKTYLRELEEIFGYAKVVEVKSGYRVIRAKKIVA
mgnify:CR=1 FL=1|jgi:16S rRNA (guanine1207-N2)-methyltransferase